jgi:hypothetical protein
MPMTPKERKAVEAEPTLAELEALIAARYPTMPGNDEEPPDSHGAAYNREHAYEKSVVRVGTRRRPLRRE